MRKFILLLVNIIIYSYAHGQMEITSSDINSNLVYSNDLNGKEILWFTSIDNAYKIAGTSTSLYLLDSSNLLLDSVVVSSSASRDPIQFLEIYKSSILTSSMKSSYRMGLSDSRFVVEQQVDLKEFQKKYKGIDKVILLPDKPIGFSWGWNKKEDKTDYFMISDDIITLTKPCGILPGRDPKTSYFGTYHIIYDDSFIINRESCGESLIFKLSELNNPYIYNIQIPDSDFKYLLQDRASKLYYAVYLKEDFYYLIELDTNYKPSKVVSYSKERPASVNDGLIHFYYDYEGMFSHSLVPIDNSDRVPLVEYYN